MSSYMFDNVKNVKDWNYENHLPFSDVNHSYFIIKLIVFYWQAGVRELETKDFDTTDSDFVQFYLRIGGNLPDCNGARTRSEGVLLQYSVDGGTTWTLLQELVPSEYRKPK